MKFAIVMFMATLLMGGVAQAHTACSAMHGKSYCKVKAERTAIRVYRVKLAVELKRSNTSLHLKSMRKLAWSYGPIHKANRWTRHMFKVVRARATYVQILHPDDWTCLNKYEAGGTWNMAPPESGGAYWGGLQMDVGFMHTYGGDMLVKYNGDYADKWSPHDQEVVAQRGWEARGYQPWPQTSIMCGLR